MAATDHAGPSLAVGLISFYQKFISPYKGFRCAKGVEDGRGGCSRFGKWAFAKYPFTIAWQLMQKRFAQCKAAYHRLKERRAERKRERTRGGDPCPCDTPVIYGCDPPPAVDCGTADVAACDGAAGCGDAGACA